LIIDYLFFLVFKAAFIHKMNSVFVIFPTQLYDNLEAIKKINPNYVFLVEEPIYFYDEEWKPFKPHKIKVAYLRACMKYYYDNTLKKAFPRRCKYIEYDTIINDGYLFLERRKAIDEVCFYDPNDVELSKKLEKLQMSVKFDTRVLEPLDLLLPKATLQEYFSKLGSKTPKHASFYDFVKDKLDVLHNVKNLDSMNRSPPPKTEPNVYKFTPSKKTLTYYKEAINYTNKHFADHYGECELLKTYPISENDAKASFQEFLHKSLANFGKYEDAVMKDDPFMYHSVISPLMNVGILSPMYVLQETLAYYESNNNQDKSIPLSSLEGFIRQVIGWRFFMQSLYMYKHDELIVANLPNNTLTFKDESAWYNGTTGIVPIDEEIKKIKTYGYAHHIVRLMMLMNFFILCNVHPYEIYRWFMEVVSMDAYSWVMISNIYAMGYFYPKVMSKPYISTSNYIVKMTNYKKDAYWDKVWDGLYHKFLKDKPSSYTFFYKRTFKDDASLLATADKFIKDHFVPYKHK
jgi:deoxyribodipyrimidine photolyase-related protein